MATIAAAAVLLLRTPDRTYTSTSSSSSHLAEITSEIGIDFVHEPGGPTFFMPEIVGSGAALFDFDRDDLLDIYFRSGTSAPADPAADIATPRSRLFHQQPGGQFVDVTKRSGLCDYGYGMGVAVGDVNNDGFPDVYAVNFGADRLFANQRDGTFLDITQSAGINNESWGSSACFLDFDRDGWLDLFVTNYVDYSNPRSCSLASGRVDYCNPKEYPRTPDKLYRNVTDKDRGPSEFSAVRFEDVSVSSGIAGQLGPGLGVRSCDANGDGWADIFVANDGIAGFLWINQRDGTFREMAVPYGVAYNAAGVPLAGMGVAEGDINHDGALDLVVTNIRAGGHAVYRRSGPVFVDVAGESGVSAVSYGHTGFGVALADLNHDGNLDMVVANGHVYQSLENLLVLPPPRERPDAALARRFWQAYADTNQVLMGDRRGRFNDATSRTGSFGREQESSRGLCTGDLDNDGDLDLIVTSLAAPARVYRNQFPKEGNWLVVKALDPQFGDRVSHGAVVTVMADERQWVGRVQPGSSYQCSNDPRLQFGMGTVTGIAYIDVQWPDGPLVTERFPGGSINTQRIVRRGQGQVVSSQ